MMRCGIFVLLVMVVAGPVSLVQAADVLGDLTIPRKGTDSSSVMPQAFFPHWIHRTRFRCYVCHDSLFQMKLGADDINMDAVRDGRFCGVCHNGKTAFAVGFDTCELCHRTPGSGL